MEERVWHNRYGAGTVLGKTGSRTTVKFDLEGEKVVHESVLSQPGGPNLEVEMTEQELKTFLKECLEEVVGPCQGIPLADKWRGGSLLLNPRDPQLKGKEIPLERFFRKICLVRERLRILEQQINNHPKLDDGDRIELQQYLTKIYGSLTTFNVLFQSKEDTFVGEKKGTGSQPPDGA